MLCCIPDPPKAEMIAMKKKAHLDLKSSANIKEDERRWKRSFPGFALFFPSFKYL